MSKTTLVNLISITYLGKEVELTKTVFRDKKIEFPVIHKGKVKNVYTDGDQYSGYDTYFVFEDGREIPVDFETYIEIKQS